MQDEGKTREQLREELLQLRQRVTQLERDRTEYKIEEEAPRASEERFKHHFDKAREGSLLDDMGIKRFAMGYAQIADHFEALVKERTAELARANDRLTLEMADRRQTERVLRESQQMLQLVLDTIPVRVFWKDPNSNFLGCNRPFALAGC